MTFQMYVDADGVPYSDYGNYHGVDIGRQRSILAVAERGLWYWNQFFRGASPPVFLSYDWTRWPRNRDEFEPHDESVAKRMFFNCVDWLLVNIQSCEGYCVWAYPYPFSYGTKVGWRSAHTQAVGLQLLVRAFEISGEHKYLAPLHGLLAAFKLDVRDGGLCTSTEAGNIWFEKMADKDNLQPKVLNGMLFALIGLWDVGARAKCDEATALAELGSRAAAEYLPRFDLGDWSAYDIHGKRASPHYHAVHVKQLELLSAFAPQDEFAVYRDRFTKYAQLVKTNNKRPAAAPLHVLASSPPRCEEARGKQVVSTVNRVASHKDRFVMLTVDTEALPKRAEHDHVKRLIWGQHDRGTAGIREMCAVASEFNAKLTFFVDACGAYDYLDEVSEVVRWLDAAGQDIQLHAHPEYLPEQFWKAHGFKYRPRFLNQYGADRAIFTIKHFGKFISDLTGKPLRAFRAGSFRWNADTIRALAEVGIPLSFNNSMRAMADGQCVYSEPTNRPYLWSNGVVEVPVTERHVALPFVGKSWWQKFQFPVGDVLGNRPWRVLRPYARGENASFLVLLLHSWSLLYWDENGYAEYRDDRRLEDFRKLMKKLAKDYDIITTADFLDLHARGKIKATHTVDLVQADVKPGPLGKKSLRPGMRGLR